MLLDSGCSHVFFAIVALVIIVASVLLVVLVMMDPWPCRQRLVVIVVVSSLEYFRVWVPAVLPVVVAVGVV